jgi:hypothetical protein
MNIKLFIKLIFCMQEVTNDGFRRTSYKNRDKNKLTPRIKEFQGRGHKTKVFESGGMYYLYVNEEKELDSSMKEVLDVGDSGITYDYASD